jgi:hypothetical protein
MTKLDKQNLLAILQNYKADCWQNELLVQELIKKLGSK